MVSEPSPPLAPLVGRSVEVDKVAAVLDQRATAVITVTGRALSGKTAIVRTICEQATSRHYRVLARVGGRGIPLRAGVPLVGFADHLYDAAEEVREIADEPDEPPDRILAQQLADYVVQAAADRPILLAIDPYRPDPGLDVVLRKHFFARIGRSGAQVVVVLAARRSSLESEFSPTLALRSGEPTPEAVHRFFDRLVDESGYTCAEDEMAEYVAAVVERDVTLLDSLAVLLPLGGDRPDTMTPRGM